MAKVIYLGFDGGRHEVEVAEGTSLMQGAKDNLIDGIDADCGGACACATCHVIVDGAWLDRLDPIDELEEAMLDVVSDRTASSRLSCQLEMRPEWDGIVLRLPESQG